MNRRSLSYGLGIGRMAIGASALFATERFAMTFAGPEAARNGVTKTVGRLFAVREIAVGFALFDAVRRREPSRRDLWRGLVVDTTDAVCLQIGARALPRRGRSMGLALAGGFAAVEAWLLSGRFRAGVRHRKGLTPAIRACDGRCRASVTGRRAPRTGVRRRSRRPWTGTRWRRW